MKITMRAILPAEVVRDENVYQSVIYDNGMDGRKTITNNNGSEL